MVGGRGLGASQLAMQVGAGGHQLEREGSSWAAHSWSMVGRVVAVLPVGVVTGGGEGRVDVAVALPVGGDGTAAGSVGMNPGGMGVWGMVVRGSGGDGDGDGDSLMPPCPPGRLRSAGRFGRP